MVMARVRVRVRARVRVRVTVRAKVRIIGLRLGLGFWRDSWYSWMQVVNRAIVAKVGDPFEPILS